MIPRVKVERSRRRSRSIAPVPHLTTEMVQTSLQIGGPIGSSIDDHSDQFGGQPHSSSDHGVRSAASYFRVLTIQHALDVPTVSPFKRVQDEQLTRNQHNDAKEIISKRTHAQRCQFDLSGLGSHRTHPFESCQEREGRNSAELRTVSSSRALCLPLDALGVSRRSEQCPELEDYRGCRRLGATDGSARTKVRSRIARSRQVRHGRTGLCRLWLVSGSIRISVSLASCLVPFENVASVALHDEPS